MKLIINGEEAKIPSGGSSGGVTMDQVNSAIDTKLDAYEPQEVYSTEEVRIGTWIDGKPLYRRVIPITLPTGDGYVSSPISSVPYVDWPVSMQGFVRATEGSCVPISFYGSDGATTLGIQFTTSDGFYAFVKSQYLFGVSGYIIFEYTKTTDTATVELEASERAVYAAAKAQQYATPYAAVTASGAAEIEDIQT